MSRHTLSTTVEIAAPPSVVWSILTDLDAYAEWNPFIVASQVDGGGGLAEGVRLVNRMQPAEGRALTFRPRVTELQPEHAFEWLGHLVVPGLFDGRHRFELMSSPGPHGAIHTVVRHSEHFRGLLVPLLRRSLDRNTRGDFERFNRALQERAEATVACDGS